MSRSQTIDLSAAAATTLSADRVGVRHFQWSRAERSIREEHVRSWGVLYPPRDSAELHERALTPAEVATRLARDDLTPGMREIVRQGGKPIRVRYRGGLREVEVDSGAVTSIGSEGGPYQHGSPQWFLEVCRTMAPVASEARETPLGAVTAIRGVTDLVRARELRRRLAAPGRVRRTVLDRHPSWRAMPTTVVVGTNGAVAVVRVEPPAGFRRGAVMTWLVEFSAVVPIGPAAGLDDPSWLAHLAAE